VRLWALSLLLALYGCAEARLPPCGASVALKPEIESGLRVPPSEIVGTVTCKLYAQIDLMRPAR
jgi:hypothetical protein